MPRLDVVVSCQVYDSFRVRQVAGMFDVPPRDELREEFAVEVPELDDEFAKDVGDFDSLAALRDRIRANMVREKEQSARNALRQSLQQLEAILIAWASTTT